MNYDISYFDKYTKIKTYYPHWLQHSPALHGTLGQVWENAIPQNNATSKSIATLFILHGQLENNTQRRPTELNNKDGENCQMSL